MRYNLPPLTDETARTSHRISQWQNRAGAIGAARATIEREFLALAELHPRLLRLALNEAEALAWQSGFPELAFPLLAQEKAGNLASWHERQQSVRQIRPLHALAA